MREICIVVEGQTEEQFVEMVLAPMALLRGAQLHSSVAEEVQRDLDRVAPGRVLAGPVLHEIVVQCPTFGIWWEKLLA